MTPTATTGASHLRCIVTGVFRAGGFSSTAAMHAAAHSTPAGTATQIPNCGVAEYTRMVARPIAYMAHAKFIVKGPSALGAQFEPVAIAISQKMTAAAQVTGMPISITPSVDRVPLAPMPIRPTAAAGRIRSIQPESK